MAHNKQGKKKETFPWRRYFFVAPPLVELGLDLLNSFAAGYCWRQAAVRTVRPAPAASSLFFFFLLLSCFSLGSHALFFFTCYDFDLLMHGRMGSGRWGWR
jgi:hypothetical protein